MKYLLPVILGLACVVLIVSLIQTKRGDEAQHESDAGTIVDVSNRLDSAQSQVALGKEMMLTLSNRLAESQSESLTFSNRLTEAEATIGLNGEQMTNLNRQLAELDLENQAWARCATDLTNQIVGLNQQIGTTQTNLARTHEDLVQAHKDYALLENRLRRDVAERLIVERKFNNALELKSQMQKLEKNPTKLVTSEQIYGGLDVEVSSNGTFHVLSKDGF
jgi:chromosome segregation ATPase